MKRLILTMLFAAAAYGRLSAATDTTTDDSEKMEKKHIVVSSLGPAELKIRPESFAEGVRIMKEHWLKHLNTVLPDHPDLIVLPEACDRFPVMSTAERNEYYVFRGDQMLDFFREQARANHCYIVYSSIRILSDGTSRNSSWLIGRDGEVVGIYDKNYPTIPGMVDAGVLPGKEAPVFKTDFGRVMMAICYDLNFQEFLDRCAAERPDMILFSSMYHGGLMQNYAAYHCRCFFVGAIAGLENNIINPVGERVAHSSNYLPRISTRINLDYQVVHLSQNWEKLEAVKAKYGPGVIISDPGYLGAVLLTSELPKVSSADMVKEFQIEIWDDFYRRSEETRQHYLRKTLESEAGLCLKAKEEKR